MKRIRISIRTAHAILSVLRSHVPGILRAYADGQLSDPSWQMLRSEVGAMLDEIESEILDTP